MRIGSEREAKRHCPIDGLPLHKLVVSGVIIDKCPQCGGTWLDSGELELIRNAVQAEANDDDDWLDYLLIGMAAGRGSA